MTRIQLTLLCSLALYLTASLRYATVTRPFVLLSDIRKWAVRAKKEDSVTRLNSETLRKSLETVGKLNNLLVQAPSQPVPYIFYDE